MSDKISPEAKDKCCLHCGMGGDPTLAKSRILARGIFFFLPTTGTSLSSDSFKYVGLNTHAGFLRKDYSSVIRDFHLGLKVSRGTNGLRV